MLQITKIEEVDKGTHSTSSPFEYEEYKEGVPRVDDMLTHHFERDKIVKYEEPNVKKVNLGDEDNSKRILVGDDRNPVLKVVAFKILMEYKGTFTWTYKDLKGHWNCVYIEPSCIGCTTHSKEATVNE